MIKIWDLVTDLVKSLTNYTRYVDFTSRNACYVCSMMKKALRLCLVVSFLCTSFTGLFASTGAGELVLTGKDGHHYTARILFNEYFSGPREFMPGQTYHSSHADHPGPFKKGFTVTYMDGRMVKHDVMGAALLPGRRAYVYESRGQIEFFHLYTYELPIQGHLLKAENDTVELRRFMVRRYDTGTPVFQRFQAGIEPDALYYLDGEPSNRSTVLPKESPGGYVLRVFPRQNQTISAFRPESEAGIEAFGPDHAGAKSGYMLQAGKVDYLQGNGKTATLDGATLRVHHEGHWKEETMPIDRKGYMILDGRYIPWRHQALRQGAYGVGATYRKWRKAKYFLVRSQLQGAWNGKIESVSTHKISVKHDLSGDVKILQVLPDGRVLLDGLPSQVNLLKPGMNVTIFESRPQILEGMTNCGQSMTFMAGSRKEGNQQPYMIVEYGLDRNRRVIREGYGPFWQAERSAFFGQFPEAADRRYPGSLSSYPREEAKARAMALTPQEGPFYWTIPEFPPVPWNTPELP